MFYDEDRKKEENKRRKGKAKVRLYLFDLREGYENPLSSLFARQDRANVHLQILWCFYRRSSACMRADGGRNEVCL